MNREFLFEKLHYQICNDCGLSQSDSSEMAANMCVIISEELARERAIGVLEYVRTRAITGNDGTWHIETDYGFSQSLTNAELYDLYLSQLKEKL